MIPPAMMRILRGLVTGCTLEVLAVSKAENGNGRRTFLVDAQTKKRVPVDPRSVRALLTAGYLLEREPARELPAYSLTALGLAEYNKEVGL